ncbi:MAG: transcription termination/antitermination protein NusG [Planctomycetales bacterium]
MTDENDSDQTSPAEEPSEEQNLVADAPPSADAEPVATDDEASVATDAAPVDEASVATDAPDDEPSQKAPKKKARKRKVQPLEEDIEDEPEAVRDWFILKVSSNREDAIRNALDRRVKIHGLDEFFGDIIVPVENVTEFTKSGKKRIAKRKLYPGYIVVNMEINDETWFLVRETPGIGDFTGAGGKPVPMLPHEVDRILGAQGGDESEVHKAPLPKFDFQTGGRVKFTDASSPFENYEGSVERIDQTNGRVNVILSIFNRATDVEFEHWQLEAI